MSRLQRIDPDQASDDQKPVIARLASGRGRIPTPFNIWLHNPTLAAGMEIIGTHVDASPVLSEAESEVAILSTAVFWGADYVIANHRRHALKAGVPDPVVEAILARRPAPPDSTRFGLICEAVAAMLAGAKIDDAGFDRLQTGLGRAVIAELLITIGYFTSVSLAMNLHALAPKT